MTISDSNKQTTVEAVAIALWNHFGSPHRIEWQDETHQSEFRNAAMVAISAYKMASGKTSGNPLSLNSLMDWHVGQMSDGFNEVRFVLGDNEEAREWAVWIASKDADVADAI